MTSRWILRSILSICFASCCLRATSIAQSVPVQVVEDSTRQGIKCEIYKFKGDGRPICSVGSTDETGKGTLRDLGKQGEVLRAVHLDYESKIDTPCPVSPPGPLVIEVHKVKFLAKHAAFLQEVGRPAAAAFVYDKAADQQGTSGCQADVKVFTLLGIALGVRDPVYRYQGQCVPSEELVFKIRDLQTQEGLSVDGRVNPATLKAAVAFEGRSIENM